MGGFVLLLIEIVALAQMSNKIVTNLPMMPVMIRICANAKTDIEMTSGEAEYF